MKTRYSRRPSSLLGMLGAPVLGALVLGVLLLVLRFVFPGALASLAEPLWNLGAASARVSFESSASVKTERDALAAQVDALMNEKLVLQTTLTQMGTLAQEGEGVAARVLARPPVTPYDVLVIAAGSNNAVQEGQSVYGPGGVPLGTVTSVSPSRATVHLYSAASRTTQAVIGDVAVTLEGKGSGAFAATVATDAPVAEGAIVMVEGLPIGVVASIEKDASSPEAVLRIRPLANPFTLTMVRVATSL